MTAVRVLVVRVGAMGDVLHALPGVTALRRARPEWEIGWVVDARWAGLLRSGEGSPVVDAVHVAATREWSARPVSVRTLAQIRDLRGELQSVAYDVCVDMQGTIRSAVIGRMAAAKVFAGFDDPREAPARWMYGRRLRRRGEHVVEQGCALLGEAAGVRLEAGRVELPVDAEAELWCDAMLGGLDRFCFLAPTAGWGAKVWPAERYGALAKEMARAGYGVVVNAVGREDATARAVVEASGGAAHAVPSTVAEMTAMLRRASVVIAGDTGPLHLAAALERPVVGLFGPTDPARNGPFRTRARVLRSAASATDHARTEATEAGLLQISVEDVAGAARELLDEGRQGVLD
ncbi:MAG: lipopolysaccharide heptosyltransferase I [Acidobacteriaceae bacterium]